MLRELLAQLKAELPPRDCVGQLSPWERIELSQFLEKAQRIVAQIGEVVRHL